MFAGIFCLSHCGDYILQKLIVRDLPASSDFLYSFGFFLGVQPICHFLSSR